MIQARMAHFPSSLWMLFTGTFLNRFGSFVSVFLVLYLTSRGYNALEAGTAVGAYGFGSLGASLAGGSLTDWLGRRSTIVLSMFSSAATMLALSQAGTLALIVALTGLAGMTSELYRPAAGALIADLVPPEQRVSAYAWYRLAINLGFAAGPAVAGFLASRSFLWLFLGDAATSAAFGLLALFTLPDNGRPSHISEEARVGVWQTLRADSHFLLFLLGSTIIAFVYFQHLSTLALQVQADGLSTVVYGLLISVNGICIICLELPISSLTRRLPTRPVIASGWLLIALGFGLIAAAHTFVLLVLTVAIWTMGEMVHSPVSAAYVANLAPPYLRGRYQGIWGLSWSAGLILGPILGTALFAWNPGALWLGCGALGTLAAVLLSLDTAPPKGEPAGYPDSS